MRRDAPRDGSAADGNHVEPGIGGMVMPVWVWVAVGASVVALFAFAWVTK
jgi:hypothetical protein